MNQAITFTGTVERFPGLGGWFYVRVPDSILPPYLPSGHWGFSKITATLGKSTWETSLMPMGNGEKFVAIKSSVRKREGLDVGDWVLFSFSVKE